VRTTRAPDTGFDINQAPVANPQLGKFPYVGLIEGYQRVGGRTKDVAFDRYEFFDGVKIISVEGRLTTIEATGPGLRLTVEGHTDNVGAPEYNRRLSDSRARSVVAALMARSIEASRLKAVGYGQDKPIADNSGEEGRAKNRRVELVKM
jgi:hypothetical protein